MQLETALQALSATKANPYDVYYRALKIREQLARDILFLVDVVRRV